MLVYIYNDNNGTACEIHSNHDCTEAHIYFVDDFDGEVKRSFTCAYTHINTVICEDLADFVKVYEV